ncbi:hypothetical protein NY414_04520 [Enterobacter hormaechei]|uniref:Uncharacterized protein n=15 Tax=Enterobacteriaceae TaxID=543 RepID=A0AAE4DU62_9ENTR|nr:MULTISPECIES: hypothetical protein [Enterobacteriaceae]MBT1693516.1 hypothetical protein [Enterobacter hormaechei subsp. hoffmannii]MBT1715147.1 hypothetical protein [Enterobacter dykesii]MBT1934467.1 hypothetical protein [Enterobacter chengduensis]MBT9427456.1 hypothetical protein [Enterobacter oligotrophicus]MBU5510735.1 hypothetical protein [Enterobacteriaceae bacterium S18_ASV_15]MBU5540561.1 hypothetical protein [Pluralibacter sp. S10_ASV_43]MBU5619598.1 hypothetical protein [Enterob
MNREETHCDVVKI